MNTSPDQYREMISRQRPDTPSLSCVVPAYNEATILPAFLQEISELLSQLTNTWEILVVDDGSTDTTFAIMLAWVHIPGIRYIRLSRNFGKEAALSAGISQAKGDVVILIDADMQHPVELIPQMLEQWRQGYDSVFGVRESRKGESLLKRFGTSLLYMLLNAGAHVKIPVNAGDYRLLDRAVVDALLILPERNRFMKGLYAWVGFNAIEIPYTLNLRASGKTKFSLQRLFSLGITGLTAFTNLPLRIWSGLGATVALVAFVYGCYVVLEKLFFGNDISGWTTLVAGTMFLNGLMLLSIGILGEYIGRIFEEVKRRPLYIISGELGTSLITSEVTPSVGESADNHRAS